MHDESVTRQTDGRVSADSHGWIWPVIRRLLFRRLHKESWVGIPLDTLPPHLRPKQLVPDPWLGSDLFRRSLVRTLRREIGSFFQRIRWLLETELYLRFVRVDFQSQLGLTRQESKSAECGYTQDSNSLCAQFPWLTLADDRILVEAWTRGALWAYRNARSATPSLEQLACEEPPKP